MSFENSKLNKNPNSDMLNQILFARRRRKTCIGYLGQFYGDNGFVEDASEYYVVDIEKDDNSRTLQQRWKDHKKKMQVLKECNIPNVYPYELHGDDFLMCKKILYECSERIPESTHMTDKTEILFHKRASHGAHIWAKKGSYKDNWYCYDINSQYPYILQLKSFKIPIKGGKACKLTKIDVKKVGIYKIKIISTVDPRLFHQVDGGYGFYTQYDIKTLEKLEYKYVLSDEEVNAFVYEDSDCVSGDFLIGDYVRKLFQIKSDTYKPIKKVLSMLWGEMSSLKKLKIPLDRMKYHNKADFLNFDHVEGFVYMKDPTQPYHWTMSRIKPFILSYARYKISQYSQGVVEEGYDVIRVHTDSILTNCPPKEMEEFYDIDKSIGSIKLEKSLKDFTITHVNKIEV